MTKKLSRPTDDELALRWVENEESAGRKWIHAGTWRTYNEGVWELADKGYIEHSIQDVIIEAKAEGVRPTRNLVNSVTGMAKNALWFAADKLDSNPDLLVTKNGTLDMVERELGPHSPKHYMTQKVHYNYEPKAEAPHFQLALHDAIKGDQQIKEFLQEFAGYCLTTETKHETAVWLCGPPGSGKSTILEGFIAMAGDMSTTLGLAHFENSKYTFGDMEGKRVLISTEQPSAHMKASSILNAIISGELIKIEQKYIDPYDIRPHAKILWAMNNLPKVTKANDGIFRRIKIVEFEAIPKEKQEPAIKEEIKNEGPGILNWALDGLDRLRENNGFTIPDTVLERTEEYQETADTPKAFLDEICEYGDGYEVKSSILYAAYKNWAERNSHGVQASNNIVEDWRRLGLKRKKKMDGNYWEGVKIKDR